MTNVRIRIGPVCPAIEFRPIHRRSQTPDGVVLPQWVHVDLVNGQAVADLAATDGTWCWVSKEITPEGISRFFLLPDSADQLDYENLVDVDPLSYEPTDTSLEGWTATLEAVQALVDGITVDTGAIDAAVTATANSAATAVAAATQATDAATDIDATVGGAVAAADIPGQITTAISAQPTVVAAAVSAVNGALVDANLLSAPVLTTDDTLAFAVVDSVGRRSWVEIGNDGRPSANSVAQINTAIAPAVGVTVAAAVAAIPPSGTETIAAGVGTAFAIVDSSGRQALAIRDDGSVDIFKPGIGGVALGSIGAPQLTPDILARLPTDKITSGPDIVCWGDSLTKGSGGATSPYPDVLAALSGRTVRNSGVGGETSPGIAARQGGNPLVLMVTGGSIPASGGVTVTFVPRNGNAITPLLQGAGTPGDTFSGLLAGVDGTVSYDSGVYTFTRSAPGSAVTCNRPTVLYLTYAEARRGDIAVFWIGQNGPNDATAITDARAMIEHLNVANKRWLVMSRPSSTDTVDSLYYAEFGRRFISPRRYLVDYGLADRGITPTAQDITDMATGTGVMPTSLRSDSIHLNADGYTVVGQQVFLRLTELGWV